MSSLGHWGRTRRGAHSKRIVCVQPWKVCLGVQRPWSHAERNRCPFPATVSSFLTWLTSNAIKGKNSSNEDMVTNTPGVGAGKGL